MIFPPHRNTAAKIPEFTPEIAKLARELKDFLDHGQVTPPGINKYGHALHHCQVALKPLNFFVMRRQNDDDDNTVLAFFNPKIIESDKSSLKEMMEGCLSFPFRSDKKVLRYNRIKVRYDVPVRYTGQLNYHFRGIEEWVEGLMAQVFQHECQHAAGQNIYN